MAEVSRGRTDPDDGRPRAVGGLSQDGRSSRERWSWRCAGWVAGDAGVRDVDLSVRAGEILGLAGLVGAGRTELARILFGLTPADAGEIRLRGRAVVDRVARVRRSRLGIAYVPEDRRRHGVILEMSTSANTTLATLRADLAIRAARLRPGAHDGLRSSSSRLGIKTPSLEAPVGNLSGGNQQKVALARWLAAKPAVLILDEPTQGVDVGAKAEIHRLMSELARDGLAILMISSELPEILGMSDRIAVMHGGTIVGVLDECRHDPGGDPGAGPGPCSCLEVCSDWPAS